MAEAIAIIGFVQSAVSLVSYGARIVKRMDEFNHNVKGLPESFVKIRNQLPLMLNVVAHLQKQASDGGLDLDTESLLVPVLDGLRKDIVGFDETLLKVLPSPHASNKEKIAKAIKSVGIQKKIDEFRSSIQDYLNALTAFQHTRHADSFRDLTALIEGQIDRSAEPSLRETSLPPVWMVKYDLEKDFVGREGIISTIEKQLTEGNHRAALAGIGGVGKSRIAIQYSYRHQQLHPDSHIFWVHGGSRSRFESDYQNIARLLNLNGREDPDVDVLRLVTDWLSNEKNGPWLMVLDNADDHDLWLGSRKKSTEDQTAVVPLIRHLPRCITGALLATTRDRQLGHQLLEKRHQPLPVSRLEPKEAQFLLSAKLSDQQLGADGIEELARELEHLPLTITQAAAYLEQTEISASEYLELFRAGQSDIPNLLEESIYDPSRDHESSNSVFQTWRLSFELLRIQSPKAADMLSLMAVLDRQAMSFELVKAPSGNVLEQKAAIAKLKAFSLIKEEISSKKLSLHRLVQLSTQRWLADHDRVSHWQQAAIGAVARELPEEVVFDHWALIQDLNSHIHIVLDYCVFDRAPLVDRAHILHCHGHYLMEQGRAVAALPQLLESHQLREEHLGGEHELTLGTLGLVGLAHNRLHQHESAREVLEKFHDLTHNVLGPRHRLTLKSQSRLAACYTNEKDREKAEKLFLQTLKIVEEEFGPNSEDAIRILTNLAYCYNKSRKWRKAEAVGLRVRQQRMQQLGPDHPDTLTIMGTLAWTYREQSRFHEAEELERQVLSRRREILGPDHEKTQSTMENLARSYISLGDWERAREHQREAFEARRRNPGVEDERTKRAERKLELIEAVLNKEIDAEVAIARLTNHRRFTTTTQSRRRGANRASRGHNNTSSRKFGGRSIQSESHGSGVSGRNQDSSMSTTRFSTVNGNIAPFITTTVTAAAAAAEGTPPPNFQSAHNHNEPIITTPIHTSSYAAQQQELARLNADLADHIQSFARGETHVKVDEFRFLRRRREGLGGGEVWGGEERDGEVRDGEER